MLDRSTRSWGQRIISIRLTGKIKTDYSYASGTGIYDLKGWRYQPEYIEASGIPADVWPEIVPSTHILGEVTARSRRSHWDWTAG